MIPSFIPLLKESWSLLVSKLKMQFLLSVVISAISILVALFIAAITAGGLLGKFAWKIADGTLSSSQALPLVLEVLPHLGLALFVLIIAMSLLSAIFSASQVKLLSSNLGLGGLLSFGWSKMLRVLLAGLVVSALTLGALGLFIIPGIVVAFLFTFIVYEVVLSDKPVMTAIGRSVGTVWHNFWPLLGRYVLIILLLGIIRAIFTAPERENPGVISMVVDALMGWFYVMYSYLVYKHASKTTPKTVQGNLTWIIVVAVLGWTLFAAGVTAGVKFALERGIFEDFGTKLEQVIEEDEDIKLPDNLSDMKG
jgi:hypothetical protein